MNLIFDSIEYMYVSAAENLCYVNYYQTLPLAEWHYKNLMLFQKNHALYIDHNASFHVRVDEWKSSSE